MMALQHSSLAGPPDSRRDWLALLPGLAVVALGVFFAAEDELTAVLVGILCVAGWGLLSLRDIRAGSASLVSGRIDAILLLLGAIMLGRAFLVGWPADDAAWAERRASWAAANGLWRQGKWLLLSAWLAVVVNTIQHRWGGRAVLPGVCCGVGGLAAICQLIVLIVPPAEEPTGGGPIGLIEPALPGAAPWWAIGTVSALGLLMALADRDRQHSRVPGWQTVLAALLAVLCVGSVSLAGGTFSGGAGLVAVASAALLAVLTRVVAWPGAGRAGVGLAAGSVWLLVVTLVADGFTWVEPGSLYPATASGLAAAIAGVTMIAGTTWLAVRCGRWTAACSMTRLTAWMSGWAGLGTAWIEPAAAGWAVVPAGVVLLVTGIGSDDLHQRRRSDTAVSRPIRPCPFTAVFLASLGGLSIAPGRELILGGLFDAPIDEALRHTALGGLCTWALCWLTGVGWRPRRRLLAAVAIVCGSAAVGVFIEVGQRATQPVDMVYHALGTAVALMVWWSVSPLRQSVG